MANLVRIILVLSLATVSATKAYATPKSRSTLTLDTPIEAKDNWAPFEHSIMAEESRDRVGGLSYVLSGSIALIGGFVGQSVATDPLEKGTYALFQTIGIASVGYGIYTWKIGNEDRFMYDVLRNTQNLTPDVRNFVLQSYYREKKERESNERLVKALTHGLIAALNIYNATQQTPGPVQTGLYFIGGVNLLAAVSFTIP